MDSNVNERRQVYERKQLELSKCCEVCQENKFLSSVEQCEYCIVGKRIRMLEVEYSDVTGWSHSTW